MGAGMVKGAVKTSELLFTGRYEQAKQKILWLMVPFRKLTNNNKPISSSTEIWKNVFLNLWRNLHIMIYK